MNSGFTKYSKPTLVSSIILALFALVTAAILALVHAGTKDRISAVEKAMETRLLSEVLEGISFDNDISSTLLNVPATFKSTLNSDEANARVATLDGKIQAYIFKAVAPEGYSGDISYLIGITPNGVITGMRVVTHKETPGLGDKIELKKNDWILSFSNSSLKKPSMDRWAVKPDGGDFDAFTGATITPRAIVKHTKNILVAFKGQDVFTDSTTLSTALPTDTKQVPNTGQKSVLGVASE